MIYLYSGTPGSGKSLDAARAIYENLRKGVPCISNFDINKSVVKNPDLFTYVSNNDLTPNFLINFSMQYFKGKPKESGISVYIDEAQLIFNCRSWDNRLRMQWCSFFSQHRKLGYDVVLIAQFDRMIDRQIRCLIEYEVIHRKANNFGFKGVIVSLLHGSTSLFIRVRVWYPLKQKISADSFRAKKIYREMYNTFGLFDSDPESKGQGVPLLTGPESVQRVKGA